MCSQKPNSPLNGEISGMISINIGDIIMISLCFLKELIYSSVEMLLVIFALISI